jgi:hypothetical protein
MIKTKTFLYVFLLLINSVLADLIELKNGTSFKGQLVKISEKYLILERLSEKYLIPYNDSIEREEVVKVIDDSGQPLFENNEQIVKNLKKYYRKIELNQNTLPDTLPWAAADTVILNTGIMHFGKIFEETNIYLELQLYKENQNGVLEKLRYTHINKRTVKEIHHAKGETKSIIGKKIPVPSKEKYPIFSICLGAGYFLSNFGEISDILSKMYKSNPTLDSLNLRTENISDIYSRFQFSLLISLSSKLLIGFTGHSNGGTGPNLFVGEIRYYFLKKVFSPWLSAGYSVESVKLIQRQGIYLEEYWLLESLEIYAKKSTPYLGIGVDLATKSFIGFYANLRYLPFPKTDVIIFQGHDKLPLPPKLPGQLNMSTFLFSAGLIINL